ncbi:hypothetical protein ACROYT_G028530 [Oculina patagonica]
MQQNISARVRLPRHFRLNWLEKLIIFWWTEVKLVFYMDRKKPNNNFRQSTTINHYFFHFPLLNSCLKKLKGYFRNFWLKQKVTSGYKSYIPAFFILDARLTCKINKAEVWGRECAIFTFHACSTVHTQLY